jgi:hypothetical protein
MLLQAIFELLGNIGVSKIDASWSASRSRGELFLFSVSIAQALLTYIVQRGMGRNIMSHRLFISA